MPASVTSSWRKPRRPATPTAGHQAEELADTLEVVYAMADQIGLTREGLEKIREDKAAERGGFRDRIIWLGNEEIGE